MRKINCYEKKIKADIEAVFERDPAARNTLEVLICYPGLHALWLHRIAHFFWNHGMKLLGRILSHLNRLITAIEIHPGAEIGTGVFIDHGSGVVIGETSRIGDDVLIYQGVVLGGTKKNQEKRHPTIEENVELGAGAILLGPIRVGKGARVGAGSVVTSDVPSNSTAVGVPAQTTSERKTFTPQFDLDHAEIPDPLEEVFEYIMKRQLTMEKEIQQLSYTNTQPENQKEKFNKYNDGAGI